MYNLIGISSFFPYQIYDSNGHAHVRTSLIGPSLTISFINGQISLGTWPQIVFVELDIRGRERKIVEQLIGND
jgi:thiamine phosphate synthase YjbQ (UPF0047 family)